MPLPVKLGDQAYIEEIQHPALANPIIAAGFLKVRENGTLVRWQKTPSEEITEINENFVSIRSDDEAVAKILPITDDARPFISALRAVFAGDINTISVAFHMALRNDPRGWRITFAPQPPARDDFSFDVVGCGRAVSSVVIDFKDGERRTLMLIP